MPSWKIHLEVAKRLKKHFKYNAEDYYLFQIGSLLPDINNGYLIKNPSNLLTHAHTHYENKNEDRHDGHIRFLDDYEDLCDPVINGYFIHLYTDHIWNKNFYEVYAEEGLDSEALRIRKQNDFQLYSNKFVNNKIEERSKLVDIDRFNRIKKININQNDLEKVENILKIKYLYQSKYFYYNDKELDRLLNKTIDDIKKLYSCD